MTQAEMTNRPRRTTYLLIALIIFILLLFWLVASSEYLAYLSILILLLTISWVITAARRRSRNGYFLVMGLLIALLTLEIGFALLEIVVEPRLNVPAYTTEPNPYIEDPDLTIWMKPEFGARATQINGGLIIYENVSYLTDQQGRRRCLPVQEVGELHALFFGDSFTFGHGVESGDTLPCVFQSLTAGAFTPYNYGKQGFGTGQMYTILENELYMEPEIPQAGLAVYSFIGDHIPRTVGEMRKLTGSGPFSKFLLFRSDPETSKVNYFRLPSAPLLNWSVLIARGLKRISPMARFTFNYVAVDLLPLEEGIKVVADVIAASKDYYQDRFSGEFIVIIWPRERLAPQLESSFIAYLQDAGVEVLIVPSLPNGQLAQLHALDGHPSPEEYEWVADQLYQAILERFPKLAQEAGID